MSMPGQESDVTPEDWGWLLGDDEWYGMCPACGGFERVADEETDQKRDMAMAARINTHECLAEPLPHPGIYEEYYGLDDLKRRMGFPEELI